jgi:hypothetical protein
MATSVQTTQRKRRYTEDDLKHLPRDGYKLRELFAGGVAAKVCDSNPPSTLSPLDKGGEGREWGDSALTLARRLYYLTSTPRGLPSPPPR